jgi:hypothetical protein
MSNYGGREGQTDYIIYFLIKEPRPVDLGL